MNIRKITEYCQLVLTLSGCFYILGYVIVNSNFILYGFYPDDFVNIRYLSAALLFLLSISIFLFGLLAIKEKDDKYFIDIGKFKFFAIVIYSSWVFLFGARAFKSVYFTTPLNILILNLGIILLVIAPYIIYSKKKDKSKYLIFLLPQLLFVSFFLRHEFQWFILANILFIRLFYLALKEMLKNNSKQDAVFPHAKRITAILTILIVVLANSIVFGGVIYPLIPRYLGGGKPLLVRLLIDKEKKEIIESLGIEMESDGWSKALKLIHRGRDSMYFEKNEPIIFSCIEVKNSSIEGVQYTGEYKLTFLDLIKGIAKPKDTNASK